ncbi:MAG TPA: phenylacetic acid degradation protein [Anaerolineae bacterium]|nr:phenylacetic acid degradation protein [Anaerolineae bacterium]
MAYEDTKFEVFKQDKEDRPHEAVGTVHAPDEEIALQHARDVFARRPDCHNLWVIAEKDILKRTIQEIDQLIVNDSDAPEQTYLVCVKTGKRRAMTYVKHIGEVTANSHEAALKEALHKFNHKKNVYVWWVFPQTAVTQNDDEDIDILFTPGLQKAYRQPNQYHTVMPMRRIVHEEETA